MSGISQLHRLLLAHFDRAETFVPACTVDLLGGMMLGSMERFFGAGSLPVG